MYLYTANDYPLYYLDHLHLKKKKSAQLNGAVVFSRHKTGMQRRCVDGENRNKQDGLQISVMSHIMFVDLPLKIRFSVQRNCQLPTVNVETAL